MAVNGSSDLRIVLSAASETICFTRSAGLKRSNLEGERFRREDEAALREAGDH